jgi:hypothetical protein
MPLPHAASRSAKTPRGSQPLRLFVCPERMTNSRRRTTSDPVAEVRGINVGARQSVNGTDRRQLERLCRRRLAAAELVGAYITALPRFT